jgi:hypothetical protein
MKLFNSFQPAINWNVFPRFSLLPSSNINPRVESHNVLHTVFKVQQLDMLDLAERACRQGGGHIPKLILTYVSNKENAFYANE